MKFALVLPQEIFSRNSGLQIRSIIMPKNIVPLPHVLLIFWLSIVFHVYMVFVCVCMCVRLKTFAAFPFGILWYWLDDGWQSIYYSVNLFINTLPNFFLKAFGIFFPLSLKFEFFIHPAWHSTSPESENLGTTSTLNNILHYLKSYSSLSFSLLLLCRTGVRYVMDILQWFSNLQVFH